MHVLDDLQSPLSFPTPVFQRWRRVPKSLSPWLALAESLIYLHVQTPTFALDSGPQWLANR